MSQDMNNDEADRLYQHHEAAISTYFRQMRRINILNIRYQEDDEDIKYIALNNYRQHVTTLVKVNCSPAFILRHRTTGELRYYHSSVNNHTLFDLPRRITREEEFQTFLTDVFNIDLLEWIRQRRPNTVWTVHKLTNFTFYYYKVHDVGRIGAPVELPEVIKNNKSILSLDYNRQKKAPFDDNLCFFRALSILQKCHCKKRCMCKEPNESHAQRLFNLWNSKRGKDCSAEDFPGVTLDDIFLLEQIFKVSINIFELLPNNIGTCVWCSKSSYDKTLNLNLYKNHFSYIKNIKLYTNCYSCESCQGNFTRASSLKRHKCKPPTDRLIFPNSCYRAKETIFDMLENRAHISIPPPDRIFPYRVTFDIETYMDGQDLPRGTEKLSYSARHRLMSISVCSNVPGYKEPKCFISDGSEVSLITTFMKYIEEIQERSYEESCLKFTEVFQALDDAIIDQELIEEEFADKHFSNPVMYKARSLSKLQTLFESYLATIPVIGFNSGSYDLNVMKGPLLKHLHDNDKIQFTIKRDSRLQCIQTDKFKFLDMINYLAPGTSYAKYLKAFNVTSQKGFFPYDYITSLSVLEETTLPPHEAFYSSLKKSNITEEDYRYCQQVWNDNNMTSLKDFLVWYVNSII